MQRNLQLRSLSLCPLPLPAPDGLSTLRPIAGAPCWPSQHPSSCRPAASALTREPAPAQVGGQNGVQMPKPKAKPRVENNRVLVTGGAGFVGSHLCTYLVNRGDHVRTRLGRTPWRMRAELRGCMLLGAMSRCPALLEQGEQFRWQSRRLPSGSALRRVAIAL